MVGAINSYEDLEVWQLAMAVAEQCYTLTAQFPREETFGLSAQIRKSAVSVPSNIAESWGRSQMGNYVQFLKIAQGSARELETQLLLASRLKMTAPEKLTKCRDEVVRVRKMLRALIYSLERVGSRRAAA